MEPLLNPADSAATRQSIAEPAPRRPPDPELVLPPSTLYERMIGGRRRYGRYSCKDRDPFLILGPSETPVTASHSLPAIDLSRCVLRTISQDGAFVVCRGAQPATSREPASFLVVMPGTRASSPRVLADARTRVRPARSIWIRRGPSGPARSSTIRGARAWSSTILAASCWRRDWERTRWTLDCACGLASVWPRRSAHCTAAASSTKT